MRFIQLGRREFITLLGGAAATWPLGARAQQPGRIPTVGVLWHAGSAEEEGALFVALRQGFLDLGYVEGKTVVFDHTYASEQYERFDANAAGLVARNVDVMVAVTRPAAVAAQRATTTIPIVFTVVSDPVGLKLVASLAHPGGNITGLTHIGTEIGAKRIAILKEAFPGISRVALLVNPQDSVQAQSNTVETQMAANSLGITVQPIEVRSPSDLADAFAAIDTAKLEAVVTGVDPMIYSERKQIAALALARRLPTMVHAATMVDDGNLMSYATDYLALFRRTATYVDKILKGEKPENIPVELPTKFELVVNIKTANAAGLTVSSSILLRSDRLIE
jgi:putative ABC transport system substrate-binding protein